MCILFAPSENYALNMVLFNALVLILPLNVTQIAPLEDAVPASILYIYDTNFAPKTMQIFPVTTKNVYFLHHTANICAVTIMHK